VVLVDKADHPGAGGVGDGSLLLRLLCDRGATDTVVAPIHDPGSVQLAAATGVGGRTVFRVGGVLTGRPYEVNATVRLLSDGHYEAMGPVDRGAHLSAGRTAVLEAGGVEIVICEGRSGLSDPEFLRRIGIEPSRRKILCIKALGTFRAAFDPIIGEILMVDGDGPARQDLASLAYQHVSRPTEPLDRAVDFVAAAHARVLRGREWPFA
jgi:microcystin degradation protein MlrC